MEEYKNLLFINGKDTYTEYGVYLAEEKQGDHKNYDSLMKPAKAKEHLAVSFRETDGETYPDKLTPALDARDIELRFAIVAPDTATFLTRYSRFIQLLKQGDNGWLTLRFPELGDKVFKVYYKESTEWKQLTHFENKEVAATIKVKFREPNPVF